MGFKEIYGTTLALLMVTISMMTSNIQPTESESSNITASAAGLNFYQEPWGNWNHYHNYTEIVNTLLYLNDTYPNLVDVFPIGKSWQNRDIYCIRLTNETNTHPKPEVFFVGYHHAREPITAELTLYFIVDAVTNYGTNATITHMLNYSEIYIVPALNVDGFDLFEANDWQRKNARPTNEDFDGLIDEDPPEDENHDGFIEYLMNTTNWDFIRWEGTDNDGDGEYAEDWIGGVDLNRNYDFQWQGGDSNPQSEIYKGPAPFSEPETQAIRDLVSEHNFTYAISFHSGAELILYPWGYTHSSPPDAAKFIEIAQGLSSITCGTMYEQSSDLYISFGTWEDWVYGAKGIFGFCCEIFFNETWEGILKPGPYPDTVWVDGLKYWFNPFPNGIESTVLRWLPVFFNVTGRAITEAYDIRVNAITVSKTVVVQGDSLKINVTMANQGYFTETFNVIVYANMTAIGLQTVTLEKGVSATVTFAWNTSSFARGSYIISAYVEPILGEADTADNRYVDGTVLIILLVHGGGVFGKSWAACLY